MAFSGNTKYQLDYLDTEGVQHITNLAVSGYAGPDAAAYGNVIFSYVDTDNVSESIRGNGLTINLEASTVLTYSDLFAEDEMDVLVTYIRDGQTLFTGWLNADGFFEDFVQTDWVITLECVDGLGYLDDLSYVDSNGLFYTGKQSQLEIITNCLNRTGISQNIYTNIDNYYTGLSTSLDVLDNVYLNADRFVKDDGDTIMSCKEVLDDILKPYGSCVTSFNNIWYIYKPNQLFNDSTPTFFGYNSSGVALSPTTYTLDFGKTLGSQINGSTLFHINSNQKISYSKSIGAYRTSYKYGFATGLISNINLLTTNGTSYDDFTISSGTYLTVPSSGNYGALIDFVELGDEELVLFADDVAVITGVSLEYIIKYDVNIGVDFSDRNFLYQITLTDGGDVYYYDLISGWLLATVTYINNGISFGTNGDIRITLPEIPVDGDIRINIYTPTWEYAFPTTAGDINITEISLTNLTDAPIDLKGEFHTFQRETKPSVKVKDIVTVNVGDNPSNIYSGTIYKTDETTPTETWFRKGVTETKPILEIMGIELLSLNANTSQIFTGDIYGYMPYLSVIAINNLTGVFLPIKYVYDTKNNIVSLTSMQIFDDTLTDIDYALTYDYGNTVKPTIKG